MDAAEPDFDELDCIDHDGNATADEVATFALKVGVPWSQAKVLFDIIDTDHDGIITHKEFHSSLPVSEVITENLRTGFREIDFDGDNLISHDEWIAYCSGWLTPKVPKATCEELFKAADYEDPKNYIDDVEFRAGGEKCQSVDDGDCSLLAISSRRAVTNRAIFIAMGHHKQMALLDDGKQVALLRGALTKNKMPRLLTGSQLFGLLLRRFHGKTSA
jgi:Ca2+-binding EF-hand superfamily protein